LVGARGPPGSDPGLNFDKAGLVWVALFREVNIANSAAIEQQEPYLGRERCSVHPYRSCRSRSPCLTVSTSTGPVYWQDALTPSARALSTFPSTMSFLAPAAGPLSRMAVRLLGCLRVIESGWEGFGPKSLSLEPHPPNPRAFRDKWWEFRCYHIREVELRVEPAARLSPMGFADLDRGPEPSDGELCSARW